MSEGEEKSGGSQRVKVAGAAAKTFVERNVPFVLAFVELILVLINYGLVVQKDNSRPEIAGGGEYTHIVSLALVLVALRALAVILDWFRIPLMTKEQSALSGLVVVTLLAFGTMDVWNALRMQDEEFDDDGETSNPHSRTIGAFFFFTFLASLAGSLIELRAIRHGAPGVGGEEIAESAAPDVANVV